MIIGHMECPGWLCFYKEIISYKPKWEEVDTILESTNLGIVNSFC